MKVQTIVSSLAISLALVAGAQAGTPRGDTNNTPFQGVYGQTDNTSRAQVVAELQQARAAGLAGNNVDTDNVPFAAQAETPSVPAQTAGSDGGVYGSVSFGDIDNQPFQG